MGGETVRAIRAAGGAATFVKTDVSKEEDVRRAVQTAVDTYGRLNILFNNAGVPGPHGVVDVAAETWDKVMTVNVTGTFFGFKHGVPAIEKSGGGAIVSTSSTAGLAGSVGSPSYSAAKGAIVNLTKSMAQEQHSRQLRLPRTGGYAAQPAVLRGDARPRGGARGVHRQQSHGTHRKAGRGGGGRPLPGFGRGVVHHGCSFTRGWRASRPIVVDLARPRDSRRAIRKDGRKRA